MDSRICRQRKLKIVLSAPVQGKPLSPTGTMLQAVQRFAHTSFNPYRVNFMRLILIRHAESIHSKQGVIADISGCSGLTQSGFEQAQRPADRLRATGELNDFQIVLHSPVLRAQHLTTLAHHANP